MLSIALTLDSLFAARSTTSLKVTIAFSAICRLFGSGEPGMNCDV